MLAIVPPIIRNKLEESPLTTTESFQRSMQEIAHSIKVRENTAEWQGARQLAGRQSGEEMRSVRTAHSGTRAVASRRRRAAARRTRIIAVLTFLSFCWGAATLFSGRGWCLALFAAFTFLLVLYWGLVLLTPYLSAVHTTWEEGNQLQRPHRKQAV